MQSQQKPAIYPLHFDVACLHSTYVCLKALQHFCFAMGGWIDFEQWGCSLNLTVTGSGAECKTHWDGKQHF